MTNDLTPLTAADPRRRPGTGTLRERRPGVWEVRVAAGRDPNTGSTLQRSITVHGCRDDADRVARGLVVPTRRIPPPSLVTLGDLLPAWLDADQPWKPSTRVGSASNARYLSADPIATVRIPQLTPAELRAAIGRWTGAGASPSVRAGRVRVVRAILGWAYAERLIDIDLTRGLRGPGRSPHRRPLDDHEVDRLLDHVSTALLEAVANESTSRGRRLVHRREQQLMMVRLAADTGARRGELAALLIDDLDGRILRIERADSAGELTTPKSGQGRSLTVGSCTSQMWHDFATEWQRRLADEPLGPWLFSSAPNHANRLQASSLGHWITEIRNAAGVPDACRSRCPPSDWS